MPLDKLKAPSKAEGLRVDTERRFLAPSENGGLAPSTYQYDEIDRWPLCFEASYRLHV